jgi:hypothetical protein
LTSRAQEAVSRVQQLDPNWRAPQSLTAPDRGENLEVRIRAKEDIVREGDARFLALSRADMDAPYPMRDPRSTAEILAPRGQLIGDRDRSAGRDVRIVSPELFETARTTLMGARGASMRVLTTVAYGMNARTARGLACGSAPSTA